MATSKEIANGIAKLFLAPQNIADTIEIIKLRHILAVDGNAYDEALHASQLLTAVQKLADRQKRDEK